MQTATISEYRKTPIDGDIVWRVYCPGGTEHNVHGKVYEGTDKLAAECAYAGHVDHPQRLDAGIAFAFTTLAGRHEVLARFMSSEELQRTHGGRKTRAYVTISENEVGMPRPPYSNRGDDEDNDRLWDTYNRWELKAMRFKLTRVDRVLARYGRPEGAKWSFSRKAGCSCLCSPGFILQGQVRAEQNLNPRCLGPWRPTPVEIWVNK